MPLQFPIASATKKPVKVFECPQETWKAKNTGIKTKRVVDNLNEPSIDQSIRQEFDETLESVKEFAASNLEGKEKKQHHAKRIEALGGQVRKNQNMPYNMLIGIKKARAVREKKQKDLQKQADVVSGKRKRGKATEKKEKKRNIDYGLQVTRGRFKNGMLNVAGL